MPDATEIYLNEVMRHARLAPADGRRIRAELKDHLLEMIAAPTDPSHNATEVLAMLNNEFGDPKEVGRQISVSKGRLRTYFKKRARKISAVAAVIVVLIFAVRSTVAEAFYVAGDGVSPVITKGSRCVVYKLSPHYGPQDVIVYRPPQDARLKYLAIVKSVDANNGDLTITRNAGVELVVPRSAVVGRVFLNTR